MCTQKVPYCYMPINIFVIALLKNMNLVCPVIAAFAEISTSFISKLDTKAFGLKETSRIKAFVFSFISVPAKWIMTARQYVLNIYTENRAYARPFKTGFG